MRHKILGFLVIPLLILVTLAYMGGGIYIWHTSPNWGLSDTFSAFAGGAFFIISTLFALALDERAKATERLSYEVKELVSNQQKMLVRLGVKLEVDLTTAADLPAALGKPSAGLSEVLGSRPLEPDKPPRQTRGARILERLLSLSAGGTGRRALEVAIGTGAESVVRERFGQSEIFALGYPVSGEESEILHFTVNDPEGHEVVFMPVFTRLSAIARARRRNPDWKNLPVLMIDGKELLPNVDPNVTVVIDPWEGPLEYQLSPR